MIESPEPGGRAELHMTFAPFATEKANKDASWTISRMMGGDIFRIPLYETVQLVSGASLSAPSGGLTWSNGQKWSNGQFWAWKPVAEVNASALKGASQVQVDVGSSGEVIELGHVVGFKDGSYDFSHVVMDVSYSGTVATLTLEPPLRRAVTTATSMQFRPSMLVQCVNAPEVMGRFRSGRHMAFNAALFVEALV